MPRKTPFIIVLTKREERELRETGKTLPYREPGKTVNCSEALRARIILMAAQGMEIRATAQALGTSELTVSKWRRRFFEQRLKGLERHSTGLPRAKCLLRFSPFSFVLTEREEREIRRLETEKTPPCPDVLRAGNTPCSEALRARMILMAAQGMQNQAIADALGTSRQTVSLWCKRFFEQRLKGLETHQTGRPQTRF